MENLPLAGRNLELINLLLSYVSEADTCVQRQGTWLFLKSRRHTALDEISTSFLELRSQGLNSVSLASNSDTDTCNLRFLHFLQNRFLFIGMKDSSS